MCSIALEAKKLVLKAEEDVEIHAGGHAALSSQKEMQIHCEEDIRATGATIWLN